MMIKTATIENTDNPYYCASKDEVVEALRVGWPGTVVDPEQVTGLGVQTNRWDVPVPPELESFYDHDPDDMTFARSAQVGGRRFVLFFQRS